MKLLARARPEILALQPYSSARMEAGAGAIMLNANESPWPPVGTDIPLDNDASALNRYPDPQPRALRERLAQLYGVASDELLVGRGSDEAIDLLVRAFCSEGRDAIVISPPTFGMYAVAARTQGAAVIEVPLAKGFELDGDAVLARVTDNTKLVFVCTPNNPTGALAPLTAIAKLALALRDRALVVVDEAYLEFAQGATSAAELIARQDNIAVLRTLSKAYALAGARVGTLIAHAQIVALLRRIQAPYPLPTSCVDAALAALAPSAVEEVRVRIRMLVRERERVARALAAAAAVLDVYPSSANFLCVRFADAAATYRALLAIGIIVRDVSRYAQLAGCLRITIGAPDENDALLRALARQEAAA
ncbi:MAG: histidinol-phosphate transaminase [Gammaproteobacteria bacterium]|nr:MAG: histidinol-phosphate transaminase [Gammaproteobacteria bacterium]